MSISLQLLSSIHQVDRIDLALLTVNSIVNCSISSDNINVLVIVLFFKANNKYYNGTYYSDIIVLDR